MPNVETENKSNAPSRKKDKSKSLAVTTEKDVSSLPQETFSPITPAIESGDSSLENVNKNPYLDVINKRLRKLNKVMRNVEKYEAIKNSDSDPQLSEDQIKVLERKGETSGAIKEFESTLKQIELLEKDELKKQAELKKAQQLERDQAIADAVEKVKATHCKSLLQLILFFRLVHFQQRGIVQLSDNEFEAVETLRAKLTTLSEEAENEEPYEEKIRHALDLVSKLNSGDEDLILPNGVPETDQVASSDETPSSYGITYSQLRSLIKNPPILETSGDQEELNETFEIINTPDHIEATTEFNAELKFMRPDDQSQPQAFDNTINNNTTFGYQSADAEQNPAEETVVDVNVQEQYSQQQSYGTYAVEQQQFTVEQQQQQYIVEQQQQQFIEQDDQQQVSTEQEELSQQQEEPPVQESQTTSEDQSDSKLTQASTQQNSNQPPPLSQGSGGHRGRYNRGNRGHRGQGSRRDSGGYSNYGGGYYRDGGNYGNYRGRGSSGPRGGRGGGYQGNRGTPYKQRSQ